MEYYDYWALFALATGVAGLVLGWLSRGARDERRQPTCACGHSLAAHEWEDGECQEDVRRRLFDGNGGSQGHQWVGCACVGYIGKPPTGLVRLQNGELIPAFGQQAPGAKEEQ